MIAILFVHPTSPLRNSRPQSRSDSLAFNRNKSVADLGKANMDKMRNWIQENVTIEVEFKESLY